MKGVKKIYFALPVLLAVLMFISNFLSTDLFRDNVINFAVWFILSIFAFSIGWIITNTLDWNLGGKIVFTVIVVTSFITLLFITVFHNYFNLNGVLTENLMLYVLRNIYIGLMGVFGMAVSKLIDLEKRIEITDGTIDRDNAIIQSAEEKAKVIISKAKLEAEKITFDAEKNLNHLIDTSAKIENKLAEFIKIEKELIEKYKSNS